VHLAHRWYGEQGDLLYEETLWSEAEQATTAGQPDRR
jgi:hypothetical protein